MTYDTAKKLGLAVKQLGDGSGAGPGTQSMGGTLVDAFRVGDIEVKNQKFIVLDYSKIQKAFNFPALDGIFGLEILQKYLTLINYETSQIMLRAYNSFERVLESREVSPSCDHL